MVNRLVQSGLRAGRIIVCAVRRLHGLVGALHFGEDAKQMEEKVQDVEIERDRRRDVLSAGVGAERHGLQPSA